MEKLIKFKGYFGIKNHQQTPMDDLSGKIFYLVKQIGTEQYPMYLIVDRLNILGFLNEKKKTVFTLVEPDFSNPLFKIVKYNDKQVYLTNHIIKYEQYDLLDISNIDNILDTNKLPKYTCRLFRFFIANDRYDICDYLIHNRGIKYNYEYIPSILNILDDEKESALLEYIIANIDYFDIDLTLIIQHVLIFFNKDQQYFMDKINSLVQTKGIKISNEDYCDIVNNVLESYDPNIESIKTLLDMGYIDGNQIFIKACYYFPELVKYLVEQNVSYDINDVLKINVSTKILEFFHQKGHVFTDDNIRHIMNHLTEFKDIKKLKYLCSEKILCQEHISSDFLNRLINKNFISYLEILITDFDIRELIDLDCLMKKAISIDSPEIVNYCIQNGIDVDNYIGLVFEHSSQKILDILMASGIEIQEKISLLGYKSFENMDFIKIYVDKYNYNLPHISNLTLQHGTPETFKYVIDTMIQNQQPIPNLVKLIVKYTLDKDIINQKKNTEIIDCLINLDIEYNSLQQTLIALIKKDSIKAKNLIDENILHRSLDVLFMTVLTKNIDVLTFLLGKNTDEKYIKWASVLSVCDYEIFRFVVEYTGVDISEYREEIILMSGKYYTHDSFRYLKLMGFPDYYTANKTIDKNGPVKPFVDFMKKYDVSI
ncbi:hypothetical protein QJ850_gp741 [Acanthamoeba polyphaga mimivirus]|uniref:Ankyrin repeat protein n=1 Tax=Acanthamoeba polyphaga mimivirus Kroon TaxID=3069720 RepID=A0A0G2Y2G2_9VIRU|nr:hypothetical protein QJ850_gp741 [Acanthamoeba polyphaga mimivirus]AKI79958.1 hypothetical protein [Acanthamoeba polyphaga mimivirus Kroon]